MNRKILIIALFVIMAVGGKMLPSKAPTAPIPPLGSSTPKWVQSGNIDVRATSVKIADGFSHVVRVIDGDTIVVEVDGIQEKIRLIGVNTPETVDPRKPVQCFGKEASAFVKNLLTPTWEFDSQVGTNSYVRLESDPSQGDRDKYGRLLRYVFLSDGTLMNKTIIDEGYGHEYTYRTPYRHQTDFKNAERTARESQKGLWVNGACDTSNAY